MDPGQKRGRIKFSCSNCRLKKKKCNRRYPCSSCIKLGIEATCVFNGKNTSKFLATSPRGDILSPEETMAENLTGNFSRIEPQLSTSLSRAYGDYLPNPLKTEDFPFNLAKALHAGPDTFEKKHRHQFRHGILAYLTMARADPVTGLIQNHIVTQKNVVWDDIPTRNSLISKSHIGELEERASNYFKDAYIQRLGPDFSHDDLLVARQRISLYGASLGIFYRASGDWVSSPMLHTIESEIPDKLTILSCLDVFFSDCSLGSFLVFEDTFRENIEKLFDENVLPTNANGSKLCVNLKKDIATITTLVVVLRHVHLHLLNSENSSQLASKCCISIDAIHALESLLRCLDLTYDSNWEVLQALTLLFDYSLRAPESDCFSTNGDPGIIFSTIVAIARSLQFDQKVRSQPTEYDLLWIQFRRCFWLFLEMMNLELALMYYSPLHFQDADFDFKLPQQAITNSPMLNHVCSALASLAPVIHKLYKLVEMAMVQKSCSHHLLLAEIKDFETLISRELGSLESYFTFYSKYLATAIKFRFLCVCKCFLMVLYYALYVGVEARGDFNLGFNYLRKLVFIAYEEFAFLQKGFIKSCSQFFGPSREYFFRPVLLACNNMQLVTGVLRIRSRCTLKKLDSRKSAKNKPQLGAALTSIIENIIFFESNIIEFDEQIGKVFNYGYWKERQYNFGSILMKQESLFENSDELVAKAMFPFSEEQICELSELIRESAKRFEANEAFQKSLTKNLVLLNPPAQLTGVERQHYVIIERIQRDKMWSLVNLIKNYYHDERFRQTFDAGHTNNLGDLFHGQDDILNYFAADGTLGFLEYAKESLFV